MGRKLSGLAANLLLSQQIMIRLRETEHKLLIWAIGTLLLVFQQTHAQYRPEQKRLIPLNQASARYKDTYVKIVYSQPAKKGKVVFGGIVPFARIWRTGDNEATEITFTQDLLIQGNKVKAGTYSLFTIPDVVKWTVIINRDLGLWGSVNYNPQADVVRFDVPVEELGEEYEMFTIDIIPQNDRADIFLMWDKTRIGFPIRFLEPEKP